MSVNHIYLNRSENVVQLKTFAKCHKFFSLVLTKASYTSNTGLLELNNMRLPQCHYKLTYIFTYMCIYANTIKKRQTKEKHDTISQVKIVVKFSS